MQLQPEALFVDSRILQIKAPSDTLTLVPKSAKNQVQDVLQEPQNPLNFLMSQLSSLGERRQTNYAHVDTQINVENLNVKIGLGGAAFLLEPPSSLTRTVENYYRQTFIFSSSNPVITISLTIILKHLCHWDHIESFEHW